MLQQIAKQRGMISDSAAQPAETNSQAGTSYRPRTWFDRLAKLGCTVLLALSLAWAMPSAAQAGPLVTPVFAQDQPAAAPGGGSRVVASKGYYIQYGIVVILFGGVIFAVCRSSHRV